VHLRLSAVAASVVSSCNPHDSVLFSRCFVQDKTFVGLLKVIFHNSAVLGGGLLIALVGLTALLAPVVAPYDPLHVEASRRLESPSGEHWFGTDDFGRDVFSRVLYGARLSMWVGGMTVLIASASGILLGLLAGYFSRIDNPVMRVMDGFMAFPSVILAIAIMAALGPQVFNVIVALAVVQMPRVARVVRGVVLQIREFDFVEAARALGTNDRRIILRHILPNCLSPLIVQTTFIFAYAVLTEASLSFLGEGRVYLRRAPWIAMFPGLAIMATVLGSNLMGDGLRDELDPRLRGT
jgi:peptide/nickel transport system permease protein